MVGNRDGVGPALHRAQGVLAGGDALGDDRQLGRLADPVEPFPFHRRHIGPDHARLERHLAFAGVEPRRLHPLGFPMVLARQVAGAGIGIIEADRERRRAQFLIALGPGLGLGALGMAERSRPPDRHRALLGQLLDQLEPWPDQDRARFVRGEDGEPVAVRVHQPPQPDRAEHDRDGRSSARKDRSSVSTRETSTITLRRIQ